MDARVLNQWLNVMILAVLQIAPSSYGDWIKHSILTDI